VGEKEWWTERPAEAAFAKALARAIRVLRAELGMSRKQLAERADLSYSYLSELENAAKQPSSRALRAVAQALGLEANELLAAAEARIGEVPESDLSEAGPAEAETEDLRTTLRAAGYPVRSRRGQRHGRSSWFHEGPALPIMEEIPTAKPRRAEPPATGVATMVGLEELEGLEEPKPALEATLEELRRLLEALSPADRERVLDLARRLRAK
jgi:transcriptional regulator with XRE-family HTH domain